MAGAVWRRLSSRVTAWGVAGVAVVVALGAILLPRGGSVSPMLPPLQGISQVGALFQGAWQSNPHFCSASVVDSPSGDLIATAAHCLSGNGQDLEFVPMYHDGQAPYGAWDVTGAYVSQRWMQHQDPQADFAFLTLSPQHPAGRRARSRASWAATSWSLTSSFRGRPSWSGTPGSGGQPVICLNQASARAGYPAFRCGGFVAGPAAGPGWPTMTPRPGTVSFTA